MEIETSENANLSGNKPLTGKNLRNMKKVIIFKIIQNNI